jgi:Family of unknown function (DUF6491)
LIEDESMRLLATSLSLFLAALAAGASHAEEGAPSSKAPEASIPFVQHGGIRDWATDGDRGVWIQDVHRNWYYARLMSPCFGLSFATRLGFDTRPMGDFDRFSSVIVPREGRCQVQSLVPSDGPPRKQKSSVEAQSPVKPEGSVKPPEEDGG